MNQAVMDDTGKLVLRLVLGLLVIQHGVTKILFGIGGIEMMVTQHGLPAFVAYGVFVGEVLGPILLIIGLYSRVGGLMVAINMLFALWLVHLPHLFTLNAQDHWPFGLQAMFFFGAIAVVLLGSGRYAARPD